MTTKLSYDDLIRQTLPLPDSSFRPTRSEVAAAENRPGGLRIAADWPDSSPPSIAAIRLALEELQDADLSDLEISRDGDRVLLDGSVATSDDRHRIMHAISSIPGVSIVIDTLRIRT